MSKKKRALIALAAFAVVAIVVIIVAIIVTNNNKAEERRDQQIKEISELESQIEELETQIAELTEDNNSLSVDREKYKAVAESDESEFLAEYFLPDDDGTLYQCITTTFYRHSTLLDQDKVENPVFTSTKTLDLKSKHGFTLFVSMSTEGLLWSTDYPFFDAIPEEEP